MIGRFLAAVMLMAAGLGTAAGAADAPKLQWTLDLIRQWVAGQYDNSTQAAADLADPGLADDKKHRLMHQLFAPVPVSVPGIPGYLIFQQASADGSNDPATIFRVGLLQFIADTEAGVIRQRELNFKDVEPYKNVHRNPDRLRNLTLDAFTFDPGCDVRLLVNATGTEIHGPMPKGTCKFFSKGLHKELTADDAVTIRPAEYWFLGRFVDDRGAVMWGNASDEPVKMVRRLPVGPATGSSQGH